MSALSAYHEPEIITPADVQSAREMIAVMQRRIANSPDGRIADFLRDVIADMRVEFDLEDE